MTPSAPSEDARNFYQQRLRLSYLVGFALSTVFLAGNVAARVAVHGDLAAALRERWIHLIATAFAGALWLGLRRRDVRFRVLELCDTLAIVVLSLLLNLSAALYPIRTVSVFNIALTTGLVAVVRAVVVPSTARRTLTLGAIAAFDAFAVFVVSGFSGSWPLARVDPEFPLPVQLATFTLWMGALIATATVASSVIYRLRREVRAAEKLGQYVVGEKLGEGGMGVVYRATHALLRRETALKLLPPDRVDPATIRRFEREVVETARLRHPSTVAIYDYGRTPEGVFYYAMEYLDGLTVGELVERDGPVPPGRAVYLLAQICASLDEAHAMGIVHRDIKPNNVMVIGRRGAYDLVKVVDFGLVKSAAPLDGMKSLTTADQIAGTPLYMAPETIAAPDGAGPASDLYAVAAVGHFLLSGRAPFDGRSAIEIYAAHLHTAPVPLRDRGVEVPPDLEALLLRGLAKSPADRPQSAAAFRDALLACEVSPWTQEDARAWWRTRGERALRADAAVPAVIHPPTVSVVNDRHEARPASG